MESYTGLMLAIRIGEPFTPENPRQGLVWAQGYASLSPSPHNAVADGCNTNNRLYRLPRDIHRIQTFDSTASYRTSACTYFKR